VPLNFTLLKQQLVKNLPNIQDPVLRSNSRATTQHQKSRQGFEAESQYAKASLLKSSWYNCLPRITQDSTRTSNWSRDSKDLTVFKGEFQHHESQGLG